MTDDDRQRAADTPAEGAAGGNPPGPAAPDTPAPAREAGAAEAAAPADPEAEKRRHEEALAAAAAGIARKGMLAGGTVVVGKTRGSWFADLKAILWLLLAVLVFHSCVAKPFYIPSESMMPGLLKGDRLVVSKYPYGWSWVSPSFHVFPRWQGRIWGTMPRRGDVVIATPPDSSAAYIKRVIGLPGDTIAVIDGEVYLNAQRLRREARPDAMIPIDDNIRCDERQYVHRVQQNGQSFCQMRVFREYIPDGNALRSYDVIDSGPSQGDEYPFCPEGERNCPTIYTVPPNSVFLMGDNRDDSADSRFSLSDQGLGGAVPWENIGGRAEFITFSLDGSSSYWNPVSWFTALRGGRAFTTLHPQAVPQTQGTPGR